MNANELADELENYANPKMEQAANMLRQQQAEIGFYKQDADKYKQKCASQQAEIEALNQRIERMIENQSHHEGIAHAGGFEAGYQAAKAKTLSDEEIWKLWQKHLNDDIPVFVRAILRKAQEK